MKLPIVPTVISISCLFLGEGIGFKIGEFFSEKDFKNFLIKEGFAEYDRKTSEWHLLNASEIQGNLIKPEERKDYVSINEHIDNLENELALLHKQKASFLNKNNPPKLNLEKL